MLEAAKQGVICNGMRYTVLWTTTAVAAPRLSRCLALSHQDASLTL